VILNCVNFVRQADAGRYRFTLLRLQQTFTKTEADVSASDASSSRRNSAIVYLAAYFSFLTTGEAPALRRARFSIGDSILFPWNSLEIDENFRRDALASVVGQRARIKVEHRALTRYAQTTGGSASVGKLAARSRSCSRLDTSSTGSLIHFRLNVPGNALDLHECNLYRPSSFIPALCFCIPRVIANRSHSSRHFTGRNDSKALCALLRDYYLK